MRFVKHALVILGILTFQATVSAQVKMNGITVMNQNGAGTGATVVTQVGSSGTIANQFTVPVTVRLKDAKGETVGEVGMPPDSFLSAPHGLPEGNYTICISKDGGPFVNCGTVNVQNPSPLAAVDDGGGFLLERSMLVDQNVGSWS
jgi:hypothetical protein